MGRTVRTFRDAVDLEESRWKDFRRTLRPHQRKQLDCIFDFARKCADAGTMIATPRIAEVVFISTMIELINEIDELKKRITDFEQLAKENKDG